MQPQYNQQPGMQLPPPIAEQQPAGQPMEGQPGSQQPEQGQLMAAERPVSGPTTPMPMPGTIPAPTPPPVMPAPAAAQPGQATQAASLPADDGDLIEKEWVLKAKAIVDRTRDDPYKQSEELTGVKADYMQKRYNKVIKLNK